MADTPKLLMPYIAQSQSSKEVTHNEALDDLDILVMANVLDRDLSAPPGSPASGASYIVKATGTGTWAGHDNHVAAYISAQWKFSVPTEGWLLYIADENVFVYWDGAAWTILAAGSNFLALSDTPDTYTGQTLKVVRVNAGETALEFATLTAGAADFLGLTDTPNSYAAQTLKYVRVNAGETALEFAAGSTGAFTALSDTFGSYAGEGQKFIAVNSGETGLEAVDAPGGALAMIKGALVKRTSDLTVATATATKIPWQAEIYDTAALWSVGSPTKIIIPSGYTKAMVFGQVRCTAGTVPNFRLRVLKNNAIADGLTYLNYGVQDITFSGDESGIPFASAPVVVAAADELELEFYQDSGGNMDLIAGEHTFFGIALIAPINFTDLGDVDPTYAGAAGYVVTVNGTEDGLEYVSPGAVGVPDAVADGVTKGKATFTAADFNSAAGVISLDYTNGQAASGSVKGYLIAADWTTFNAKMTNPMTTAGDIIYGGASGVPTRLAVGATKTGLEVVAGIPAWVAQPYDVGGNLVGAPTASLVMMRYPFPRAVSFPSGLTASQGVAATAATAQTDFDLLKNGVSFATMRFAAAGTVASFIAASPASFAAGDILTMVAPASPDATLAHMGWGLAGTR